jgi:hypothetical protein
MLRKGRTIETDQGIEVGDKIHKKGEFGIT